MNINMNVRDKNMTSWRGGLMCGAGMATLVVSVFSLVDGNKWASAGVAASLLLTLFGGVTSFLGLRENSSGDVHNDRSDYVQLA